MSTREIALSIFNQLSESQSEGFIALFNEIYSESQTVEKTGDDTNKEKAAAFERIEQIKKRLPLSTPISMKKPNIYHILMRGTEYENTC